MRYERSSKLFKEAKSYLVGGVNSPVRSFRSVGGSPIYIKKAKGCYLYDEDGNDYIDCINSWGPMILGHAHPEVTEKVIKQIELGTSFGTPTELETEMAKQIIKMVPHVEKVRMVNSGTEACMSAVRLARGYTGKDKIIKFEGCYHGHADAFLIAAGSGATTLGSPDSSGVTQGVANDTLIASYNNLDSVKYLFENHSEEIAAIIVEPVAGNMGCIPPNKGFLQGLRDLCDKFESLLIFDEVMTGFRLAKGGAQELYGIKADLVTFGKIIGGGFPVGAFAGSNDVMSFLAPEGKVYQAGTLSGNPIAMRAGLETLTILDENPGIYTIVNQQTEKLEKGIKDAFADKTPIQTNRVGSMFSLHFTDEKVTDFNTAKKAAGENFNSFFKKMLDAGIYLPPSAYESWFICKDFGDKEIQKVLETL